MLLREHVYYVAVTFKMTEWVEQWMCIKFCIKFEHPSAETILMIQKAVAMGNWVLAASSQQCSCLCIASPAEFFGDTSNHPGDSAAPRAQIWCSATSGFSKTKITFEREGISDHQRDSGKYNRAAEQLGELCEVPRDQLWRALRRRFPMHNVSCISYLL